MYIKVRTKFIFNLIIALGWFFLCFYLSISWIKELAGLVTLVFSVIIIFSIALVPGFMYMFLLTSYLTDSRKNKTYELQYPAVSVLIAAYNEENSIEFTLNSIKNQKYPAKIELFLIDDGSVDRTVEKAKNLKLNNFRILKAKHKGKAAALNLALQHVTTDYVITIDADTFLQSEAIKNLMNKLLTGPQGTIACAGSVYVKNSRATLITRIQEWDYFHAIAVIKRSQSFYQGTLVAQGCFSVYTKESLQEVKGWPEVVGEDIVLTWALLNKGYRIDFAEEAISFTNVPETYKQFFFQRSRWARGLFEAFYQYPDILLRPRLSTFYVYWNLFFILFDNVFFFIFIPGVIAAFFGYFYIAGPMTLAVLPLGILSNLIFYVGQRNLFQRCNFKVRKNILGFVLYVLFYQFLMNPAVIYGYVSELLQRKKTWGTKK
ncbi:glycosyltransferase [Legionella quateirensis]|uniref:Glycosyltransferase, family 2 n=1 Tax=Legionella quateirensis TaxID=45072 RepID=A0A378KVB2_9GAMM|nr:glycosyltransferase family 2 protein [Legionella quateirensis]KTD47754.1 glycosyltransferase, family 2 [Legionella quateirensis]STY18483.1 glycosyltransferase, family 2 [Legionella quateirensis]